MIKYILECDRCGKKREFEDIDEYDDAIQELNTVVFRSLQNGQVVCKGEVCDECLGEFLEICKEYFCVANSFFTHRNKRRESK